MRRAAILTAAVCLVAAGCVSQSKYEEEVAERNKMEAYNVALANRLASEKKSAGDTKEELSATKDKLGSVQQELLGTRDQLNQTRDQLASARGELSTAKDQLTLRNESLKNLQAEKERAEKTLTDTSKQAEAFRTKNDALAKELEAARASLSQAQQQNSDLGKQSSQREAALKEQTEAARRAAEKERGELAAKQAGELKALEEKKAALEADVAARDAKVRELQAGLADAEARRSALEAQKAEAEKEKVQKVDELSKTYEGLLKNMEEDLKKGNVTITRLKGQLSVKLLDAILFSSGSAEVKKEGKKVLDSVASALAEAKDQTIVIEGHTDNVPIGGELALKFPSNWELSTARAVSVVRYLSEKAKIDPTRLTAAGFGEYRPVGGNDTPEGREKNRRIEIKLVPLPPKDEAAQGAPAGGPPPAAR